MVGGNGKVIPLTKGAKLFYSNANFETESYFRVEPFGVFVFQMMR